MTTDNFFFFLKNRLIQFSQTGGQRYSDTSPFSIPWSFGHSPNIRQGGKRSCFYGHIVSDKEKKFYGLNTWCFPLKSWVLKWRSLRFPESRLPCWTKIPWRTWWRSCVGEDEKNRFRSKIFVRSVSRNLIWAQCYKTFYGRNLRCLV